MFVGPSVIGSGRGEGREYSVDLVEEYSVLHRGTQGEAEKGNKAGFETPGTPSRR
jgi:hypothetical protein